MPCFQWTRDTLWLFDNIAKKNGSWIDDKHDDLPTDNIKQMGNFHSCVELPEGVAHLLSHSHFSPSTLSIRQVIGNSMGSPWRQGWDAKKESWGNLSGFCRHHRWVQCLNIFFLNNSQPPWFIAILPNEIAVNWGGHHIWTNPCGPTPWKKRL